MSEKIIKVAIIGSNGRMGQLANQVVESMPNCSIVAKITRHDDLGAVLKSAKPDVAIELTSHESVFANARTIITNKVYPIIGSSGLTHANIESLSLLCNNNKIGGIIAPNFSLGIAVISKMAKDLKQYYDEFSIIEFHHAAKKDKPSGTARYTSQLLGAKEQDICSIRSNGFVAKQQVYVSSPGERILIDHENFDRNSFAKGISLCVNKVLNLDSLVVGLENIL
ncbi:MAG TPA: dihydrodipicolinate reductase C-terminal domain-containing protein [Aquella sp.]|nr:dihydrodipicolinate reductase C-terminal domain-containing protein [Aquella sp.]